MATNIYINLFHGYTENCSLGDQRIFVTYFRDSFSGQSLRDEKLWNMNELSKHIDRFAHIEKKTV